MTRVTVVLAVAVLAVSFTADGTASPGVTCEHGVARDCTSPGTVRWWLALDGPQPQASVGSASAAAEGGGMVFAIECDVVRALDRATGELRWKTVGVRWSCAEGSTLTYGDGLLMVAWSYSPWKSQTAYVAVVLDAATGVRLFEGDGRDEPVGVF